MTSAVDQMGDTMKAAAKQIDPLKREFRALRAEVRLVDFGDITDDRQFKKATNEVRSYITSLQRLERQIQGDTTAEREFTAQLKQQQRVMATRIEMQEQQRIASQAAARVGEFQVVQQAGQLLVNDKLIGQAKDAINVFASFDDKMAGVAAITTATGDSLDALREKAKYLGATTRFTASEAADAMSFLGMAGFKTEAILSGTQATLDLASAGQLGLAESADISSNVLSGMQLKVEDLGHVTDVMARTATSANTNIQQMGVAMSYAAPNAALFGATIEETSALIGVMSNAGIQADKAGTAARASFLRLASPLKDGKVALQELGITLTDESGNMRNVIEIFNELNTRLKISPDTLKSIQDAGEDIEALGAVSQSKQIQYLKGIFGTTGISGAAAALSQVGELNRLAIATRASSTNTEQLVEYFTELKGIRLGAGQDIFAAIIEQTPSYTDAVRQIDEANLALMQVNLKTLNTLDSRRLTEYFQQVKGIRVAPGEDLLSAVTANAPDSQAALNQVSTAMGQLGIEVKGQIGAARLMAQVMENNLAGSFRSLESAMEAVQVNFIEPLTPLIRAAVDAATKFALFLANLPAPVRSAISVTAGLTLGAGALAIAIGAAGVTLFGFQQAMAVTSLASTSLAANLIPLTGFFDTAQKAIVATNPLETFFQRNTQLAGDFERAAAGTFDETLAGMKVLARQSLRTGQAFLVMSRSLLLSPIGLSIAGFLLLNTVVEQVVPGFNLLGTVLGAIAAPFGFIYGLLKGITHSFLDFLGLTGSGAMGAITPMFGSIANAIELAAKSFSLFAASGDRIGEQLGQAITAPFKLAGQVITSVWQRTIGTIRGILRPFADFVQHIGQLLISFLAEASPGPTYWIRTKWAMTVQFLQGLFERLKSGAATLGQQLSGIFTAILPKLSSVISVATLLAELSGLINPIEGLVIAIGNTIFGGIVEAMGKSLDQVIPIFIRRFSLIATFGGFLAQRLNFIQPFQARIIAGVALITSLSTFYFKSFGIEVTDIWRNTVDAIKGDLQSLAGVAKNIGLLLISFLAEASPGPTFWIRTKWEMTIQFLQNLFERIKVAADLVNQAFLGIGDVAVDQRMAARQVIFENVILTLVSGVKSLFYVGQALTWVYNTLQQTVSQAIANFDFLSFSLLTVASLPATMVPLLREGFEQIIPELELLAGRGIPRAIVFGLPGAIAIAMSSGLVKGFEQGFANFLAEAPSRSAAFSHAVYGMFNQGLKNAVNQGLSEGVTAFVRAMPQDLGGRADFTLNFDFDQAYAAYEEQRNARVIALVNYLREVGDVARDVGAQLQSALAPILSFQFAGIPVIPFFTVILPFKNAVLEIAASPAVQGFIGFLAGTVLPTAARTLAAIATTVAFIFNTFVTLPIAAAVNVLTREAVGALRAIVQASVAFVTTIPALLGQAVVMLAQRAVNAIALMLARIPYIGQALSQAFLSSVSFLVATSQVYFQLLSRSFQAFASQIGALLGPAYRQLTQQILQGIVYAFEQGVKPIASILTNLFVRAIDPRTTFRFLSLYFRTGGFRQVFKPGLFAINPIDLLFGGFGKFSQGLTAGFKLALGVAFPANIISSKQAEVFQILADPLSKAKAARFGLMVKLVDIVESLPPALRPVLELLKGLMLVSPVIQIIGRLAIATMFWYSILKPLNPEIYQAIENTTVLGMSLSPIANLLRGMRFVFVDAGEALFAFARAIPPFVRATQQLFNLLGTTTGAIVHEAVGITSILLNIFKATFGNLFLVVAIGFAEVLDIALINLRNWATFLRLKTQQYGDAIVAALHGHFGPLIHQIFSDIAQGVTIVFRRTVGIAAQAIASLVVNTFRLLTAIGDETIRFLRDPFNEGMRLGHLFQDWVNRTFGGIVSTINTYIQQLQLDRLARFLGHFWIQLAAIADILLLVTGVLNPLQFLITGLIGLGLFLVNEYRTGFQTLDALIAGLAHPIEFVTNAINTMVGALGIYIPPELTQFISGVTEQFVKSLPIITGGVFLLALLIRRNIGSAFQDVVGGVMKIVSGVMQAVEATRLFGDVVRDTASSAQVQTKVGAQVHQVRRRETLLGIRNPFAYSQNEDQQRRAVMLGDERVAKSRAALRYQDEINKSLKRIAEEEEAEIKRLARSRNARDQILAFGGRLQRDDGFSYDVAPLLEKRKGLFGLNKLELSEAGRARVADQARRRVTTQDSESAQEVRMQAAQRSGLAGAFQAYSGQAVPDEVLKALGRQGDYGVTSLLGAFQKAMENLHIEEFKVNKLYVAEVSRPQNFPTQTPYNTAAADRQLGLFRSNPEYQNLEVIKKARTSQGVEQVISSEFTDAKRVNKSIADFKSILNTRLSNLFDITVASESEISQYASRLANKLHQGDGFINEQRQVVDELIQKQFQQIARVVPDFKRMEESNLAALREEQRKVEGFHPIATNANVLAQAVRNVAGQTQSDMEQLNRTRSSLFSALFGFTGIPQLMENFQYNQRLFRRSQRISRRVEEMARGENRERAVEQAARQRGFEALMSRTGSGYAPDQSLQFYAAKQINAQEQAFIQSWIKNRSFKVDISQHEAFRSEVDTILKQFQGLSTSLTFNTIEDVKKFQQLLTEKIPEKERAQLKKLEQFILHGAAQQPKGDQLSFADRDHLLEVINKTIGSNLQAFGVAGNYQDISKVNLNNLRDKYNDTVNHLMSRFIGTGELIAQIGGKNEYIEGAYKALEQKLGLGRTTGASLRQIQNVKLQNTVRQIGVNFGLFVQDIEERITGFRDGIYRGLDNFQVWLESRLPFPSFVPHIVDLIRRPFEFLSNNIEAIYAAQKTNIQNLGNQIRANFIGSNVVSRINSLNQQYKEAREASLQTILQSSKDERIASLARRGAATGQLGRVWEKLNKQQFTDAQSGQAVTAIMRGAMSKEAVRAMLQQELRRQGLSKGQISTEIDKVLSQFGDQARYSVGDILKMRGLDATKVSKALESALSLEAKAVKEILSNPSYTARAVAPFQLFLVREIPRIIKDASKDFIGTVKRFGGGVIARFAVVVARDITIAFKGDFLNVLAKSAKTLSERLGVGANNLAVGMERIVGRNPFSDAVRRFSDFLRARGKAAADFLKAQALAPDDTRSLTKLIKNRTIELFKTIGSAIQSANAAIQTQGGGVFGTIRALLGGLKGFFGKLFNRQQNSPLAQLDAQIQQQRDRAAKARELQRRAQAVVDERVDPWVRDSARKMTQRQYDVARQADDKAARLQRQRDLTETFSSPRYSGVGADVAKAVGNVMGRVGKVYEKSATQLGERVKELRSQYTGVRVQEIAAPGQGQADQYQPKPGGGFFTRNTRLQGSIASFDEYIRPLTAQVYTKLTESAYNATLKLSNYFQGAATRSQNAWERSANAIAGKSWFSLVKRAVWTGINIVTNLNHGAADITAAAWQRSEQSVSQDMHQMAQTAQATGQQVSQSMEQAAQQSTGFLSHIGNSIGKVGRAGMAIGGAVTAVGFGAQTAMYSLSTMGLVGEETSEQLRKFFEIFTLLGAIGGIATPIFTALASSLGAVGAIAGTVETAVAGIGAAIAPLIGLGGVAFAPFLLGIAAITVALAGLYFAARNNFLGIGTLVQGVGHLLGSILAGPISFIEAAWQGFVDRFGSKLMPIVQPALDIAQGLINALNHNPTEKIPQAWEIAGERIKGVLDSILGAGQTVGNGLVSFFAPIVSLFSPLANLFGKKKDQQQKNAQPEVIAPEEKPEQGMLGSIMGAIVSLVMLPVNLIKGLADVVSGIIAGVIKGVVTAITGPLQWAADALRPLQMPIAQIELFFKNLVSIVQSVVYLNAVMRPLAANAIGINATINEIAKFFFGLRSLVESAEFLYYHVLNRKALAQGGGQGGNAVDPDRYPGKRGEAKGYEATGGKAILDLTLAEAGGEIVGIGKNIWSLKESAGAVFGGFKTGLNWLGNAWQFTMGMIKGETGTLVADAEAQGYNLQKNLSEGSPGPTFWIRQNWEKTTKALQGWMGDLSGESKKTGQDIATNLTPDPVTPTPTISPVLDSPRQATGFTALKAGAIAAIDSITKEVRAKSQLLEQGGVGVIAALFLPGLDQTISNIGILAGDIGDFAKRSVVALATLNFGELSDAAKDFGGNFAYVATGILSGFKQMSGGVIAFGLYTVTSVSPFLVILGGVAFVAAVIVANFLGLRTVLSGAFRVGIGLGQAFIAVIGGIIDVGRSLGLIIGGVFLAMRGDFSLLDQGIVRFKTSFRDMGQGVARGFRVIQSGILQILQGIQEGITQIFPMFPEWVNQLKTVAIAFRNPERAGEIFAEVLIGAFNRIRRAIGIIPVLLGRIPGVFKRNLDVATTRVTQAGTDILGQAKQVYQFFRSLTFRGIVERLITEVRVLPQFLAQIPGLLANRIEQSIPALTAPFNYLRSFVRGFVRRLAQELPSNVAQAVSAALQSGVVKIRSIFLTLSSQVVSIFRQLVSRLGLEERFNQVIQKVSERWSQFAAWVRQGNLFNWAPKTTQEFTNLFVRAVNRAESLWGRFTNWLSTTPIFSAVFTQLERLSRAFANAMGSLDNKWSELKVRVGIPVFTNFFDGLRSLGTKFIDAVVDLAGRWESFAKPLKLPVLQNFFTEVALLGERFNHVISFLERRWQDLASFIFTTPLISGVMRGLELLGRKFNELILFVQLKWTPFVEFLSSSNLFPAIFSKLREFGTLIPQLVSRVKTALVDIPGTAKAALSTVGSLFSLMKDRAIASLSGIGQFAQALHKKLPEPMIAAIERIQRRWEGFASTFRSILEPITVFATWVAEKLIKALNCSPTVKIPVSWDIAVNKIISTLQLLIDPFRRVGEFIVSTFRATFALVGQLLRGFYEGIAPGIERITQAVRNIRKGAAAAGEISRLTGLGAALVRLREALDPLQRGFLKFVEGLRLSTSSGQQASGAAQILGRTIGKVTLFFLEFGIRVVPPLLQVLKLVIGLTVEVIAFGAKVAYALRFVASYFTRIGFAAAGAVTSIFRFVHSGLTATGQIKQAFGQLQADTQKFVVNFSAGMADLGQALKRLVGVFLDVFAPQLKPVFKSVLSDMESFVSLIRFALIDLVSSTSDRMRQLHSVVTAMSPFDAIKKGLGAASRAVIFFGSALQRIGEETGFTQSLTPVVTKLTPIAKWLGIVSKNAQGMAQAFKESGVAISSALTSAGTQAQEFFGSLLIRAKEAIEPIAIYYRAALDDVAERIRASFPFQVIEGGFKQVQAAGSVALTAIQSGADRAGAALRQVLVALNLDVPFDQGVTAVRKFGDESVIIIDWALSTMRKRVEQVADSIKSQFLSLGDQITNVIAQVVAQIYVKIAGTGDSFRAVTAQVVGQIDIALASVRAFISQALQPYAPIIEALRDVVAALQKIGASVVELISDFSIFGVKVGGIIGDVILNFGKATYAIADFAGKVLTPVGLIGIANAVFNIVGAIKDLVVNVGMLVGEAIPVLGRLGTAIKELLLGPLESIGSLWTNTIGKIQTAVTGLTNKVQTQGAEMAQGIGEVPARKSWQFWRRTTQAIQSEVEALTEELQVEGHEIQAAISEGSPGTTRWIRHHWERTTNFVREQIQGLSQTAKTEGSVIQESLGGSAGNLQSSGIKQLQGEIEGVSEHSSKLANTAQSLFTSMGSVLSNFAPQLAMPLFMVNDFITAFFDIKKAIPEVRALIQGTEAVTVASNAAIAVSEVGIAQAAGSSAIVLAAGAAEAGAAKTAEAAVVGGANSWMAVTYGFLANAARSAYRSMIVPLAPFLPMILGVSAGVFLLYKAFQANFSGIGDVVKGVANFIQEFFGLLFSEAWRTLASIFSTIEHQISAIGRTLQRVGRILMEPFRPLFAAFGVSGGRGVLGNAMVATVNLVLLPLKLVAGAINLIVTLLGGFIQGAILIGGVILNFILLPIRIINATIYGIVMGFKSMMLGVSEAINNLLLAPLSIATAVAYKVAGAITQVGRIITNFILAPFFALQNAVMRAIGPVVDFVLRGFGFIAGAATLVFAILNPGLIIGAFFAFVTGATLAARAIQFILGIPLRAIEFIWRNTVGKILGVTQGFVETAKGFGAQLKIYLTDPTASIRESWQLTIAFIQSKLSELGVTAKVQGQNVAQSLTQSISPRFSLASGANAHLQTLGLTQSPQDIGELKRAYRQQSRIAHPDAGGDVEQFRRVQDAYEHLKASMEVPSQYPVIDTTPIDQATRKVGTLTDRMRNLGSGFDSTLSSMGGAIANFSPQLAAPFFILSDFINAILSLGGLLPGLKAFFAGKKAAAVADAVVTTTANSAIASSNLLVAATSASTALTVTTGAVAAASATTTEAVAVGGANTFMAATYGVLANAARWAYTSILAPLAPLLPAILVIVAAIGLLYLAFKTNFLGIGDVIRGVVGGFVFVFGVVWGIIKGIWNAIAQVVGTLISSFGEIFAALKELAGAILQPFVALLGLFGGTGGGGGSLEGAINATVGLILVPIKFIADSLSWVIKGIAFLIVGVIRLGTAVITGILSPIAKALGFLAPASRLFGTILGGIAGVILGVITLLGLIGVVTTVLIPLLVTGATALFGMVASGMTFLIATSIPLLMQGLAAIATVAIPLLINALVFVSTVAIPAIISGLVAIGTTAIPFIITALSGLIPLIAAGFAFVMTAIVPAVIAGLGFIATVAIPAIISSVMALIAAAIPLVISFAPILLAVLAVVAAVWLLKTVFEFVFKKIAEFIPFVIQGFRLIGSIILSPFMKLWELVKGIIGAIGSLFSSAIGGIKGFFQNIPLVGQLFGGGQPTETGESIQQFAKGGLVQGQGSQAVPIIAHADEFVVNPEATRANLGVLEYLNAGGQLALPTPSVGIMPPMPLNLPAPVAVPTAGAGGGTTVIENLNFNFEVQLNTSGGKEAADEFLRYVESPRFKQAVRQNLRELIEKMK